MNYKKMKNKIILIMSRMFIVSLSACGNKTETGINDTQETIKKLKPEAVIFQCFYRYIPIKNIIRKINRNGKISVTICRYLSEIQIHERSPSESEVL